MKFSIKGSEMSTALTHIRKAVPKCSLLTISANGHLELIGSNAEGQTERVIYDGEEYSGVRDGAISLTNRDDGRKNGDYPEPFALLEMLFRDKTIKDTYLDFEVPFTEKFVPDLEKHKAILEQFPDAKNLQVGEYVKTFSDQLEIRSDFGGVYKLHSVPAIEIPDNSKEPVTEPRLFNKLISQDEAKTLLGV